MKINDFEHGGFRWRRDQYSGEWSRRDPGNGGWFTLLPPEGPPFRNGRDGAELALLELVDYLARRAFGGNDGAGGGKLPLRAGDQPR